MNSTNLAASATRPTPKSPLAISTLAVFLGLSGVSQTVGQDSSSSWTTSSPPALIGGSSNSTPNVLLGVQVPTLTASELASRLDRPVMLTNTSPGYAE